MSETEQPQSAQIFRLDDFRKKSGSGSTKPIDASAPQQKASANITRPDPTHQPIWMTHPEKNERLDVTHAENALKMACLDTALFPITCDAMRLTAEMLLSRYPTNTSIPDYTGHVLSLTQFSRVLHLMEENLEANPDYDAMLAASSCGRFLLAEIENGDAANTLLKHQCADQLRLAAMHYKWGTHIFNHPQQNFHLYKQEESRNVFMLTTCYFAAQYAQIAEIQNGLMLDEKQKITQRLHTFTQIVKPDGKSFTSKILFAISRDRKIIDHAPILSPSP